MLIGCLGVFAIPARSGKQALSNNESWDDLIDLSPEDYAVRNESAPDMVTVKIDREEMNQRNHADYWQDYGDHATVRRQGGSDPLAIGIVAMIGGSSNLDCAVKGVTALFPDAKIATTETSAVPWLAVRCCGEDSTSRRRW